MAVGGVSDDRNYTGWINGGSNTNATNTYNAVITSDNNQDVSMDDFFQLMITQMTNQDFLNPSSDTEYMSQMAQFYAMQSMQEVSKFQQQSNALSLVGQTVTASKYNIGGAANTQTGVVEKIVQEDGEYRFFVNGVSFTVSQIQSIQATGGSAGGNTSEDNTPQTL